MQITINLKFNYLKKNLSKNFIEDVRLNIIVEWQTWERLWKQQIIYYYEVLPYIFFDKVVTQLIYSIEMKMKWRKTEKIVKKPKKIWKWAANTYIHKKKQSIHKNG